MVIYFNSCFNCGRDDMLFHPCMCNECIDDVSWGVRIEAELKGERDGVSQGIEDIYYTRFKNEYINFEFTVPFYIRPCDIEWYRMHYLQLYEYGYSIVEETYIKHVKVLSELKTKRSRDLGLSYTCFTLKRKRLFDPNVIRSIRTFLN